MPDTRGSKDLIREVVNGIFDEEWRTQIISQITDMVYKKIKGVLDKLGKQITEFDKNIEKVNQDVKSLQNENTNLKKTNDKLEQYSRRTSLRIFGLPEHENEQIEIIVLKLFRGKLKLNLKTEDLGRLHRVGRKKKDAVGQ